MKLSEAWLREWVNPSINRENLCTTLTMAGLEVEEFVPVSQAFNNVVVGQVIKIKKHPEAERLQCCEVNVGKSALLNIVCGAENVKEGMKAPVALLGATLGSNLTIARTSIRGVTSEGMLCSAAELGLAEESQGLLELPADAPIGEDLKTYLQLEDYSIDVSITPNRGDCLSIKGMAREVSALTGAPLKTISIPKQKATIKDILPLNIEDKEGCPHYVGRIIRNVKADAVTPVWLKERLRRSGIRSISPIVDVTNYVMLELGQPMHAFDLKTIEKKIQVRLSKKSEKISLLDGTEKELDNETLVIADQEKPLAIAGVMGGLDSGVTLLTTDIFLESAYFSPKVVARQRQFYGLNSDSAYRFERGVDPAIQAEAIERATHLILEIVGGEPGPLIEVSSKDDLPKPTLVTLTKDKINGVLGLSIPDNDIDAIFDRLLFRYKKRKQDKSKQTEWEVHIPSYRADISIGEDLIEEIARLHGYDKIPTHSLKAPNIPTFSPLK